LAEIGRLIPPKEGWESLQIYDQVLAALQRTTETSYVLLLNARIRKAITSLRSPSGEPLSVPIKGKEVSLESDLTNLNLVVGGLLHETGLTNFSADQIAVVIQAKEIYRPFTNDEGPKSSSEVKAELLGLFQNHFSPQQFPDVNSVLRVLVYKEQRPGKKSCCGSGACAGCATTNFGNTMASILNDTNPSLPFFPVIKKWDDLENYR